MLGVKTSGSGEQKTLKKEPPWSFRIKAKIQWIRKMLNQLYQLKNNTMQSKNKINYLRNKFQLNINSVPVKIEELKQQLAVYKSRFERYTKRDQFYKQNKMFNEDEKKFYQSLEEEGAENDGTVIDKQKMMECWKNLWENPTPINRESVWISAVENNYRNVKQQESVKITLQDVQMRTKKLNNWKSPGKDGIHNFWIKKLTCLHQALCNMLNDMLEGNAPQWLLEGRTVLIRKSSEKNFDPNNYRPITCLSNLWKIFSGIISDKIYSHLISSNLFPNEQKGCRKKVLGTKDQLLINKAIMENARQKQRNLSTCWRDYKKAYDSVSHEWIIQVLKLMKIDDKIVSLLTATMCQYRTVLVHNNKEIGEVEIRKGIYQGDSLSPLLFVMALFPLSHLLSSSNKGFKLNKTDQSISHLWFVDDLKLYAKNENEMKSMLKIVETFSKDIGMSFGIDKCKWCKVEKGVLVEAESIDTEFGKISALNKQENLYKYLGILERERVQKEKMKEVVKKEYKERVRKLLRSYLNARNLIQSINTYAVPVIRYSAAIVDWTDEEINKLERSTRKWLSLNGAMNLNSDINRLYVPRNRGGKGLMSIKDTLRKEKSLVANYIKEHKDDELLRYCVPPTEDEQYFNFTKQQLKEELITNHEKEWKKKIIHGKYFREVEKQQLADYAWLKTARFKKETEALIMAAQEGALRLNYIKHTVDHTTNSGKCRMCQQFYETVEHVVCGCPKLARFEYVVRHNRLGAVVHWALARQWGFQTHEKYYHHIPERVLENEACKILWDFSIRTDKKVRSQRPDMVIVLKKEKCCFLVDFSVPWDYRVKDKMKEKIEKYEELSFEIKKIWKLVKVEVIPIIVGALGSMWRLDLQRQLARLGPRINNIISVNTLQKEALLGTARILRKTLNI
jgi:hypothetical protein